MCTSFNWESYLTHVRRRQSLIDAREKKTKYMVVYLAAGLQKLLRREKKPMKCGCVYKQEAHGPHRSPEKTVQINKHI